MYVVVTPEESGKRADVIIAHHTGFSRSLVAEAVRRGDVRVNGAAVKGSYLVSEGDVVEAQLAERPPLAVEPEAIDLTIIFEDDDVLVVDKPAGMVTHPAHGATSGTLVNALLAHVSALPGETVRAGLIHRLDRDTSGLLVIAKTEEALSALGKAMKARHISREYLGLVTGVPQHPKGTIDGAIGRDPHNRLKYAITADGKPAITHYEVRERLKNAAELLFRLETGRTHQIRVHMAAMGHPLVNDPIYGKTDPRFELPGQALHAWRLAFRHPRTGQELEFQTDPPPEYSAAKAWFDKLTMTSNDSP
ncbi:MAG TPA: RluA family pseudouridine synthase [Candidatus Baltobacteraceae bacterium]|nr:RluA family pseudouridine synthase [Candidatus Baltobacteraceae bacterium]